MATSRPGPDRSPSLPRVWTLGPPPPPRAPVYSSEVTALYLTERRHWQDELCALHRHPSSPAPHFGESRPALSLPPLPLPHALRRLLAPAVAIVTADASARKFPQSGGPDPVPGRRPHRRWGTLGDDLTAVDAI